MNAKHKKIQIMSLMTLTVILCALPSMSLAGAQWSHVTDMPTPRVGLSTSVVDGKIYAIGGRTNPLEGKTSVATVEQYDPTTNLWTMKASMISPRYNFSTNVVDGRIYAISGFPGGAPATTIVEMYDPATDTWTRKADLPTRRATLGAGVVNGKIYTIGGGESSIVEVYDPISDTWTRAADMPTPRHPSISVVDGKIYAIGGLGVAPNWPSLSIVEEYDPATDAWVRKADMTTPRDAFSTVVFDGRIYAIGGANGGANNPVVVVEVYDPAADTWIEGPSMSNPRVETAACIVDGQIYVIGGWRQLSSGSFGPVETLDLNPIVDFNADGAVDIDDLLRLIESWDLDDPLVDIGPMPWGDGIIDARDLLVLAEHMVEYDNLINDLQASLAIQPFDANPNRDTATYTVTFSGDLMGGGTREDMPVYNNRIEHMPLQQPLDLHAFFDAKIGHAEADVCFPDPTTGNGIHGIQSIKQNPERGAIISVFFDGFDHNGKALVYRVDLTGIFANVSNWPPAAGTSSDVILTDWKVQSDAKGGRNKACRAEGTLSATVEVYRAP